MSSGLGRGSACTSRDAGDQSEVGSEQDDDTVGLAEVSGADNDAFGIEVSSLGVNAWVRSTPLSLPYPVSQLPSPL